MKQQTLAMAAKYETGFKQHLRPTWRDEFLDTMDRIVPWAELCVVIEQHYPKLGNAPRLDLNICCTSTLSSTGLIWPELT